MGGREDWRGAREWEDGRGDCRMGVREDDRGGDGRMGGIFGLFLKGFPTLLFYKNQ